MVKAQIESGNVSVLDDKSVAESEARVDRLNSLIEDARTMGCVPTLEKYNHDIVYLFDPRRSKYLEFAEFRDTDDVLEIGSSLGQHTRLIAGQCRHLSAIEVVEEQARFSRIWCDEEGINNVDITSGGGSGQLPYGDAQFDCIICNYVLEWCAGRSEQDPEAFHRAFLTDIFRCLKPGGRLLLSTKNRFALRYLTGAEDRHLGVRFGSALPRALQKRLRDAADLDYTVGYLHSWAALGQILRDVGFDRTERFFSFPDHRYPLYIGRFEDFDSAAFSAEELSDMGGRNRLALRLPKKLRAFTSNSLFFRAWKA